VTEPNDELKVEATQATPDIQAPAPIEQEFDPKRAMETIQAQRESEKALKAQVKELSAKAKRLEELEAAEVKRKEAEMSETERLQKQLAEAQSQLKAKELSDLKRAIAEKVGLPSVLAERLQGADEATLEEDAKKLLETLPKASKAGATNPTNPGDAAKPHGETEQEQRDRINGTNRNLFDPATLKGLGGGVLYVDHSEVAK
jgi:alanyl-tRNA synthetase